MSSTITSGPDGNYLREFSPDYFTDRYENEWGEAINFDGENSGPCGNSSCSNAGYWIDEFHLDGLRLDATQQIFDESSEHIIARSAREFARRRRAPKVFIVGENEPQDVKLAPPPERGGYGLDALWNDDFHHSAMVALTGRNEAYYTDYLGKPQEFISAAKYGFLYQGQRYKWQKKRRGTPTLGVPPDRLRNFHSKPRPGCELRRVAHRCMCLPAPGAASGDDGSCCSSPQNAHAVSGSGIRRIRPSSTLPTTSLSWRELVREGAASFSGSSAAWPVRKCKHCWHDPDIRDTFESLQARFRASASGTAHVYQLHRDLLRLRREDPVFSERGRGGLTARCLATRPSCCAISARRATTVCCSSISDDLHLDPAPEPLLAPPAGHHWETIWSSENPITVDMGSLRSIPKRTGGFLDTRQRCWRPVPAQQT